MPEKVPSLNTTVRGRFIATGMPSFPVATDGQARRFAASTDRGYIYGEEKSSALRKWIRFTADIACRYCIRLKRSILASVPKLTKLVLETATLSTAKPANTTFGSRPPMLAAVDAGGARSSDNIYSRP